MFATLHQTLRALRALKWRILDSVATVYYRVTCRSFGNGTRIGWGTWIAYPDRVDIGNNVSIARRVTIGSEQKTSNFIIEDGVQINECVKIDFTGNLRIGRQSLISESVIIYTHSHGRNPRGPAVAFPKSISEETWIGARSVIMHGCQQIGRGAIIGVGCVVTKNLHEAEVVVGAAVRQLT